MPFLGENLPTIEMLAGVKAANGISVFAHPSRKRAWECFTPDWSEYLLGIEAWNRKYDGWAPSNTAPALFEKSGAVQFVGLDFHTERQSFPLAMALDLNTRDANSSVTEEKVLECLRARRCSARAFGSPLNEQAWRTALPVLRVAEQSRRTVASFAKRTGVFSR